MEDIYKDRITQVNDSTKETSKATGANVEVQHSPYSSIASDSLSKLSIHRGYYSLLYTLGSKMVTLNNYLYKLYVDVYGNQSASQSVKAIECFTYNLIKAVKLRQKEISFSSDTKSYNKVILDGKSISVKVGHQGTKQIVDLMESKGLITTTKGYRVKTGFGVKSKSGYITLSQEVVRLVEDLVDLDKLKMTTKKSVLVLRDKDSKDLDFTENKYTKEIIKVLTRYNKMMDKHVVEYKGVTLETGLARIFNTDFDSGGRLYATGGSYQTIPAQTRNLITIDGVDTAEVDIKGSHISILHTMIGGRLLEGYDPYEIEMEGIAEYDLEKLCYMMDAVDPKHNPFRNLVKVALLIMVNASNIWEAKGSLERKVKEQLDLTLDKVEQYSDEQLSLLRLYGLKNVDVSALFKKIRKKHKVINKYFFSGAGVWLQKLEGDIFTKVVERCVENQYPVLIIHDSCRAKIEHIKQIGQFITQAWYEVIGDTNNLQLEYEF